MHELVSRFSLIGLFSTHDIDRYRQFNTNALFKDDWIQTNPAMSPQPTLLRTRPASSLSLSLSLSARQRFHIFKHADVLKALKLIFQQIDRFNPCHCQLSCKPFPRNLSTCCVNHEIFYFIHVQLIFGTNANQCILNSLITTFWVNMCCKVC